VFEGDFVEIGADCVEEVEEYLFSLLENWNLQKD
jgi:hypothetical protein